MSIQTAMALQQAIMERDEYKRQRDRLLEAAQRMLSNATVVNLFGEELSAVKNLRAAIADCKAEDSSTPTTT